MTPTGAWVCDVCHAHVPTSSPAKAQAPVAPAHDAAAAEPVLVTVADVERQSVSWLWEGRLPRGRLTVLDGDPGVGKSWLALAVATAITRGTSLPGQENNVAPADVLLLTAEDGIADTVRPRLEDMGADLKKVTVLTAVRDKEGQEHHPSLVNDLAALDAALSSGGYGLVIIDPINAYLGASLDTHRDAALRSVLTPLALLAERWGVAILCVRHLTKSPRDKAIYRGQGNIAYTAAARVVHLVGVNPDNPTERVLVCIKNNLAPEPPSLAFELTDRLFLWRGETSVSAAALLRPDADEGEGSALAEAQDFLRELLADGPVEAKEVERQRREAGIADRTLQRAKAVLGVKSERQGQAGDRGGGSWSWVLSVKDAKTTHYGDLASLIPPDTETAPAQTRLGTLNGEVEGHRGPNPHTIGSWPPMEGLDREAPQQEQKVAPYGAEGRAGALPPKSAKDHSIGNLAPLAATDRDSAEQETGLAPLVEPLAEPEGEPDDDGRRKLVVDLWQSLGCPRLPWKPGETICDLAPWSRRATDGEVEQVILALEAMPEGSRADG